MRNRLLLVAVVSVLSVLVTGQFAGQPVPADAAGSCGGAIRMSPELNPAWDYLAINIVATGVSGCTAPRYQFAFWNGTGREVFRDYSSAASAYWDTHNLVGTQYISIYVKDAASTRAYDTYSPWLPITLRSHNGDDSYDDRENGLYLQNIDPQGDPETTIGRMTTWLSTYITFEPGSNIVATAGTPQCSGVLYPWQGAYAIGIPGNGSLGGAFVQPGFAYYCSGQEASLFAVAETSAAISCPLGGSQNFGATDDVILPNDSGVSESPVLEYKGCYVGVSRLGIRPGGIVNFDMHSVGATFSMGANGIAIFSAAETAEGLYSPWLDTEIAGMNASVADQLNAGLQLHTAITRSYAFNDTTRTWFELTNGAASSHGYRSWYTVVFGSRGSASDGRLYCDRPFGYYGGWNGARSSYLFARNVRGRCG